MEKKRHSSTRKLFVNDVIIGIAVATHDKASFLKCLAATEKLDFLRDIGLYSVKNRRSKISYFITFSET